MGGVKKVFTLVEGGVQKVLALAKGGSKKFDDENFQLPSPPHQSIYEHSLINSSTKYLISVKIAILTPNIIPLPLVNVWLIFDLQKYVNWLCVFLEVNPCFQKAHVFCMDLQPAADPSSSWQHLLYVLKFGKPHWQQYQDTFDVVPSLINGIQNAECQKKLCRRFFLESIMPFKGAWSFLFFIFFKVIAILVP